MIRTILIIIFGQFYFIVSGQDSELVEFNPSTCDLNEDVLRIRDRISDIYLQNDTLYVTVGFVDNCGYSDYPLMSNAIFKNDTLNLYYDFKKYEVDTLTANGDTIFEYHFPYYECDCCFEFQYVVKNVNSITIPIKLNDKLISNHTEKYKTFPIRFELFEGDTINLVDKYGFRQGKWLSYDEDNRLIYDRNYINDSIDFGTDYRYHMNDRISQKLEWKDNEHQNYYKYDENGKLILMKKSPFED